MVRDPSRHEASRSSVLAILGQRGYAPALTEARKLAPSAELPGIRRAAVGVVGRRGDASDVALLQALTTDAEPSIRLVATQALKALEKSLKPKPAASPEAVPPQ
jgi:HEAT repeat protein